MPLIEPTPEDIRKIHAEINQIVHQRFLVTTSAITILGVVLSWLHPKEMGHCATSLGGFIYFVSTLLLVLLFSLFLYSNHLRRMLRVLTSYLIVTEKSNWERDWQKYRKNKYSSYSSAQTIIFNLLGIAVSIYPILIAVIFSLNYEPCVGFLSHIVVSVFYFVAIFLVNLYSNEDFELKRWRDIKEGPY